MSKASAMNVHFWVLAILTALFAGRVAAQALQRWAPVAGLPSFDAWHSGALPYATLLTLQIMLLLVLIGIVAAVAMGHARPARRTGKVLAVSGAAYFAIALGRFIAGATIMRGHWWMDAPLATAFHLVLAGFVLALAHFHLVSVSDRRE